MKYEASKKLQGAWRTEPYASGLKFFMKRSSSQKAPRKIGAMIFDEVQGFIKKRGKG